MVLIIAGLLVITSIGITFSVLNKDKKGLHADQIIKEYDDLRKIILKAYKKNNGGKIDFKKEVESTGIKLNYNFILDKNGKFILLKVENNVLVEEILSRVSKLSFYEKPYLHLSIYDKGSVSIPVPEIHIEPKKITTTTDVSFSYKETSQVNHTITKEEWTGVETSYSIPGSYEVSLRIKNARGVWSDTVSKKFMVVEEQGIKAIRSNNKVLFLIYKNGRVKYKAFESNKLRLPIKDSFSTYDKIDNVLDLSMSYDHMVALKNDRTIEAAGSNDYGQLALTSKIDKSTFTKIWGLEDIKEIQTGKDLSAARNRKGHVFLWGKNDAKQIHFSTQVYYDMPQSYKKIELIDSFSVGRNHVLYKTKSGKLYGQGANDFGQIGNGYSDNVYEVQEVLLLNVDFMHASDEFSLAVTNDGKLYGWGKNNHYQLGMQGARVKTPIEINKIKDIIFITSSENAVAVVTQKGEIYTWGTYIWHTEAIEIIDPVKIDGGDSIKGITICHERIYVLSIDDELFVTNDDFELEPVNID